jgi:hypothetical protein
MANPQFLGEHIAKGATEVTPSDATVVSFRGLYVGGAGNVSIVTPQGDTVTFVSAPAGGYILCAAVRVRATGTTATSIIGLR